MTQVFQSIRVSFVPPDENLFCKQADIFFEIFYIPFN